MKFKQGRRGFTVIELLIAILAVAILFEITRSYIPVYRMKRMMKTEVARIELILNANPEDSTCNQGALYANKYGSGAFRCTTTNLSDPSARDILLEYFADCQAGDESDSCQSPAILAKNGDHLRFRH
jgi:prepilin-type N-terminal cleavage/methylation domain-containing protein